MSWGLTSEDCEKAVAELALFERPGGFKTVRVVPAVSRALTNCLRVEKSFLGAGAASGSM
jgi:hypothetical protein